MSNAELDAILCNPFERAKYLIDERIDLSDISEAQKIQILKLYDAGDHADGLIDLGFTLPSDLSNMKFPITFLEAFNLDPVSHGRLLKDEELVKLLKLILDGDYEADNEQIRSIVIKFKYSFRLNPSYLKLSIALDEKFGYMNHKDENGKHFAERFLDTSINTNILKNTVFEYIIDTYLDDMDTKELFVKLLKTQDRRKIKILLERKTNIVDEAIENNLDFHTYYRIVEFLEPYASDHKAFTNWVIEQYSKCHTHLDDTLEEKAKMFKLFLQYYTIDEIISYGN
jgi:hypothetical protein